MKLNIQAVYFVLGAPDPEMAAIEAALRAHGARYGYAATGSSQWYDHDATRVHPGAAYKATTILPGSSAPYGTDDTWSTGDILILVECGYPALPPAGEGQFQVVGIIDHHNPGDPGYGAPPEEFVRGSSLGQLLALLGQEPTDEQLLVMAGDHCPGAAYRGECPGVDPQALMEWRAASRAAFQGRSVESVLADIESAMAALRAAPTVRVGEPCAPNCECGGGWVSHYSAATWIPDLRGQHVPELPEAALRLGVAYLATAVDRDGRQKVVLGGSDPHQELLVQDFLAGWAVPGLMDKYGDPARGFAGGYVPAKPSPGECQAPDCPMC